MFDALPRPLLFAHRGASAEAPENTLEAFERAIVHGADVLELDVHRTLDDEVVVFHDETVDRTTNGTGRVAARTLSELRALDAGWGFTDRSGAHPFRERGLKVPLLAEVLGAFSTAAFNVELKAADDRLLRLTLDVLKRVVPERVLLTGGQPEVMARLEAAETVYPLGMSRAGIREVLRRAWTGRRIPSVYRGRALQIPPRLGRMPVATRPVIRAAQRSGLEVHVWTINDPAAARRWLRRGIDGLMSDDPGAMAPVFAERRA